MVAEPGRLVRRDPDAWLAGDDGPGRQLCADPALPAAGWQLDQVDMALCASVTSADGITSLLRVEWASGQLHRHRLVLPGSLAATTVRAVAAYRGRVCLACTTAATIALIFVGKDGALSEPQGPWPVEPDALVIAADGSAIAVRSGTTWHVHDLAHRLPPAPVAGAVTDPGLDRLLTVGKPIRNLRDLGTAIVAQLGIPVRMAPLLAYLECDLRRNASLRELLAQLPADVSWACEDGALYLWGPRGRSLQQMELLADGMSRLLPGHLVLPIAEAAPRPAGTAAQPPEPPSGSTGADGF